MQETQTSSLLKQAFSEHQSGNYFEAEKLYRHVLFESPNNIKALQSLAALSITIEQPRIAIELLNRAISIRGDCPDILYNLGLSYQNINDIDSAIYYYHLTIALDPEHSLAYNNLGVAYQHLGEIELANAQLEKAFTISPECIDAYYNYSQSHKFTLDDKYLVEKIEHLLKSESWNDDNIVKLNFTLGKIYDDLKDYGTSFKFYENGNSIKDKGFDLEILKSYIDNITYCFSSELLQKLISLEPQTKKTFIFIIGMPRSGSTLIEQIISSHSEVQSAGETGFIGDIVDEFSKLLDRKESYPECIKHAKQSDLMRISKGLQQKIDILPDSKNVITEKSPTNFFHIGLILMLFPTSIIIHSKRNNIDTCLSCFFQNFSRQHRYSYDLKNLALFHNEYDRLMTYWKSIFSDRIHEINYEDLVNNQEDESKQLIKSCNLKWDENCLNFHTSNSVVNTASKWQVRRKIYKTSVNKWTNYERYIEDLLKYLN